MSIITGLPNISAAAFWLMQKTKSGAVLFVCKNDEELEEFAAAAQTFAASESGGANGAILLGEDKFSLYGGLYDIARGGAIS